MRILVLHNTYQLRGGEDAVVDAEVDLLRSAGHEVRLERVTNESVVGLSEMLRAFLNAPHDQRRAEWVANLVRDWRANIVHIHNFFPLLTPAVHEGAVDAGAAVVQTLHNYRLLCANAMFLRDGVVCEKCLGGSRVWGVVHRCYRGSLPGSLAVARMQWRADREQTWKRKVHRFVALTEFARGKFIEGGLPADQIMVKPNFVQSGGRHGRIGGGGGLFVGRLSLEKGAAILIDAWRRIPQLPLTIVGDGPERVRLEAMAPPNVTFMGHCTPEQVKAHMQRADCLIVPSLWYEGFPMTIAEAFAIGMPVIASRLGSLSEIVRDGVNGYLFPPGDTDELARVVMNSFSLNRLPTLGKGASETYRQYYTPAANLKTLENIYAEAIGAADRIQSLNASDRL